MTKVNIDELDASDLADILTELKGAPVKVKNAAASRKELVGLLAEKNLVLGADDEGNFTLTAIKPPKGKTQAAKAAPEPEVEDEEEDEEEEDEEEEDEEEEEEEEEAPPPPPAKTKKAAPAPAPAPAKSKKAAPAPAPAPADDEEDEEEVAPAKPAKKAKAAKAAEVDENDEPKAKRAPPPREPKYQATQRIKVLKGDHTFAANSKRAAKLDLLKTSKTVGAFLEAGKAAELPSLPGFLAVCVKAGIISIT